MKKPAHPISANEASGLKSEGYFRQSRRPLASLVFVLPLVALYEVGTWGFHLDAARNTERRIVAFTWLREAFAKAGATGWLLPPLVVVAALLGWHLFARHPWRLRVGVLVGMAAESVVLALPLMLLLGVVTGRHLLIAGDGEGWAALAVLGVGAGVYEELLFRLLGFLALHVVLVDLLALRSKPAMGVTLLVTSLLFSAYHYLGGQPFDAVSFTFPRRRRSLSRGRLRHARLRHRRRCACGVRRPAGHISAPINLSVAEKCGTLSPPMVPAELPFAGEERVGIFLYSRLNFPDILASSPASAAEEFGDRRTRDRTCRITL